MQRFKKIILPMQGHNKKDLHWLYNTASDNEPPLIFNYCNLKFWFGGTSYRSSEKLFLYVQIPNEFSEIDAIKEIKACETYILGLLSPMINELSNSYLNTDKNVREKAQFEAQRVGEYIACRNGIRYDEKENSFIIRINFNVPLVNALSVNAKSAVRAVRDILEHIEDALNDFDRSELSQYIRTYIHQQEIRRYMKEHNICSFIANGSILPRENGTSKPMKKAIPFVSPKEAEVEIPLSDGTKIVGMGIKNGVTVITGGGYSGKSTLLDAIEMGIYDHIPNDGREYVLTDNSALKIYAEDGRPVSNLDISPFFKFLPGNADLRNFSTLHSSGSVSQASNIVEAVCGKCKLLLIDEDKSATNFMIRDKNMRLVVKNEPIIPFTDRIRELFSIKGVSTILVIGGSSEYLTYADTVILMDDYVPHIITEKIRGLDLTKATNHETAANWTESRKIVPKETTKPFLYFKSVETENEKKIILDEYSADITLLTALISEYQLNTLACVMEGVLTDKEADNAEIIEKVKIYTDKILIENNTVSLIPDAAQKFYEQIRPIDAYCCVNRMRGVLFKASHGLTDI